MTTKQYMLILTSNKDKKDELYDDLMNKCAAVAAEMYAEDLHHHHKFNIEIININNVKEYKAKIHKLFSETEVKIINTSQIDMEFFTGTNYKMQYSMCCPYPKNIDHIDDNQLIYRSRVKCIHELPDWFLALDQITFDRIKVYIDKPINTDIAEPFVEVDFLSNDRDVGLSTTISKLNRALDMASFFSIYDCSKIYIDSPKGIVDHFYIDVKYENGTYTFRQHF